MPKRTNMDIKKLVYYYNKQMSIQDIADALCTTKASITWYIKKARNLGLIEKDAHLPIKRPVSNETVDKIVELYKCGLNRKEIATKLNLSYATVAKYLHETNTTTPPRRIKYTKELLTEVAESYNYGCYQSEICMRFNMTQYQARTAVRKAKSLGLAKDFSGRLSMFHEVADYHKLGYTIEQMMEELEISRRKVNIAITTAISKGLIEPSAYPELSTRFI